MDKDQIYLEYNANFQKLLDCMARLNLFLYKQLHKEFSDSMPILTSRTKSVQSLAFKIEQMESSPTSILEIHDIIGIRIICLTESVVKEIVQLIPSMLNIEEVKDTRIRLGENQFGYTSIHLIGKMISEDSEKIRTDTEEDFVGLKYEIQVRTYAQHIFADLAHKYSYKSGKYIPSNIKRPLFRVAALSETIDEEINRFEQERKSYLESRPANSDELINIENLRTFLSSKLEQFRSIGEQEDYEGVIRDLKEFEIKRIPDLENLIDKHYEDFRALELKRLEEFIQIVGKDNEMVRKFIDNNYIYSYVGTIRNILNQEFKTKWVEYKENAIDKPMWDLIKQKLHIKK